MTYRVPYAQASYTLTNAEVAAVVRTLQNPARLVAGPQIAEFEDRIRTVLGMRAGVMVNSGSSANLIALLALKHLHGIQDGATVLTPVLTGGWIVGPILQAGLKPVFCDVEPGTYVASPSEIRRRVAEAKPAILLYPLLLGNSADLIRLAPELRDAGIPVLVDSCDTLNPPLSPTLFKVADAVTTSFYASHIITAAGGGGMACFRNDKAADHARMIAYWGRQSISFGDADDLERRFQYAIDGIPYDAKFVFAEEGYNVQPLELQAAFGLVQLDQLGYRIKERRARFAEITAFLDPYRDWLQLPIQPNPTAPVWLAYPITIMPGAPFTRMELARHLEENGVQTRPIMGGNILRQPAFRYLRNGKDEYLVADYIMRHGLMFGCHESLRPDQMTHLRDTFLEFLGGYG